MNLLFQKLTKFVRVKRDRVEAIMRKRQAGREDKNLLATN